MHLKNRFVEKPGKEKIKTPLPKVEELTHKVERTLVIIKPEHVHLADKILEELDNHGKRIKTAKIKAVPKKTIEQHYAMLKGKSVYGWLITEFIDKPAVIAIYEGKGIIQKFVDITGVTDPPKASKESIRGKYGEDSLEKAISEKRALANVIHRSTSAEEAEREINIWKQFLNGGYDAGK